MKDTLSIFITAIIFVLLIVVFPLYNYFERQDDMSYNLVLKATTDFVDEVINTGYISQEMYTDYIFQIANTGNLYDIEIEGHRKVLVKVDGLDEYEEQFVIDYNNDIFSDQVTNSSNINDKVIKNGVYKLNVGDKIYVKLKNSSITMAGALFNIIVPTSSPDTIKVNYGGIVKNNTWQQANAPLFESQNIKLSFDLNTNGNNNALYNSVVLQRGISKKLYTGTSSLKFDIPTEKPTRTNCTFKSWSTTKDGSGKRYFAGDTIVLDESSVLYAVWQYNDITLTLKGNGGEPSEQTKTLKYNGTFTVLENSAIPIMNGYTFDGWYTSASGGRKVTASVKVTSTNNLTLYAHWKANQMTITLNANGGSVTPSKLTGTYKGKYTGLPTPTKTGHTFKGWYLNSSFTTIVTESTIINTSTDHTLYAKWSANTYTITFDGNGGNSTSKSLTYGSTLGTLPTSSRSGYTFNGWYTSASGGSKISSSTTVTGNATYYAHWTRIYRAPSTPTITVKNSSGNKVSSGSWSNTNLTITIAGSTLSSDSGGSIGYQYSYNGSNWYNYTGAIVYSTDTSSTTIYARAYNTGNTNLVSSSTTYTIKLDKTPPTIDIDVIGENSSIASYILAVRTDSNGNYHVHYSNYKAFTVDVWPYKSISDSTSGVEYKEFDYTGSLRWQEGQYLDSTITARDYAGNKKIVHIYWYGNNSNGTDKWPY